MQYFKRRTLLAAVAGPMLAPTMAPTKAWAAAPLRLLGTGAVEHAVHDLAAAFTAATGQPVLITIGNAGGVARRLRDGEPADLVINSASQLAVMAGAGLVEGPTIVELGRMRIGLGVQAGAAMPELSTPAALRATLLAAPHIAYSDPASGATTGIHLLRMMDGMGIGAEMAPRSLVFTQGLDAAKAVAEGRATLVMTQISEILAVPGVRLVGPLPAAVNLVTPYSAALPMRVADRAGATALLRWLRGPEGRARFEQAGFLVGG